MRVVVTSDTHDNYPVLPDGDLLIHCGDISAYGTKEEVERALAWLNLQPHRHKVLVPGNHDRALEEFYGGNSGEPICLGVVFVLVDTWLRFDGLSVYGSPWTLPWQNFAFQKPEEELRELYKQIPEGLDILVTHGPPWGILDQNLRGVYCGSRELREVGPFVRPRYHVFGHIHEAAGTAIAYGTAYHNVSWVALDASGPKPANPPLILEL